MNRTPWRIAPLALALLAGLGGCADEIDDPDASDSVLVIESLDPSVAQADIFKVSGLYKAVTVDVTINSIPRGTSGGSEFNDVILEKYTLTYNPPLTLTDPATIPALSFANTLTVPAGGSATFTAVVIPSEYLPRVVAGTYYAKVEVTGHDVLGSPASAEAALTIQAGNFPD